MAKPTSGLAWENHIMGKQEFSLDHLHPHFWEITIPSTGKHPARSLQLAVSYSLHCFTRRLKDGETVSGELSKYLPDIIATLEQRRCLHTGREEFVTVEVLHEGQTLDYAVFFTVTKGGKSGADLNLFVNSAHDRAESIKHKKPIRFHLILLNRYLGKPIKPPA